MSVAPVELRSSPLPLREPHPAARVDTPDHYGAAGGPMPGQAPLSLVVRPSAPAPPAPAPATPDDLPQPPPAGPYPEPGAWAARFVLAALEVAQGVRPPDQLVRWTSPEVHAVLARRARLATHSRPSLPGTPAGIAGGGLNVLRTRCAGPAAGVCEVAAVVRDRGRIRAVALRLEALGTRWRVTELQIG